ncbi:cytochrome P450 [Actinocrispum sp. NPDC049592]|uniref:cytochrome P450 n=1 Tax=Actinocrispum sp. NPDC049592 TaxID=3154835 RepID=UPI003430846F
MAVMIDFPRRKHGQISPPVEYADLRQREGLVRSQLPNGSTVWLVTRHQDVRTVLTSPQISSNPTHEGFPNLGDVQTVPLPEQIPGWFVGYDQPDHGRFRKTLIPEFTVRKIRELRPAIEKIVNSRVDAMLAAGPPADLVNDFALPVPSLVICAMLGVPYSDHEFFEEHTRTLVRFTSTQEEREEAVGALVTYLNRLVSIKQRFRGTDLISKLLAGDSLTAEEIVGVGLLLLIAGHETTANNIAIGTVMLLLNRQWIGDPRAVEEVLRFASVADLVSLRVAVEDVEIGGELIRAGEGIVPLVAAANHDVEAFDRAAEFDPSRPAKHHVAFGYGVHQCLGQNLVRAEIEIAYQVLFSRIPTLDLAMPVEDLPFKYDGILFGVHELPVTWTAD